MTEVLFLIRFSQSGLITQLTHKITLRDYSPLFGVVHGHWRGITLSSIAWGSEKEQY